MIIDHGKRRKKTSSQASVLVVSNHGHNIAGVFESFFSEKISDHFVWGIKGGKG